MYTRTVPKVIFLQVASWKYENEKFPFGAKCDIHDVLEVILKSNDTLNYDNSAQVFVNNFLKQPAYEKKNLTLCRCLKRRMAFEFKYISKLEAMLKTT